MLCWKWPTATVPLLPSLCDRLVTCCHVDLVTCPHGALALTAPTLNSLDNSRPVLRVIVSYATRENGQTCRPHAVIGRQWLSLRSSWHELELHNYRQLEASWQNGHRWRSPGTRTTVWALRDDVGPENDADGWGCWSSRFVTKWRFRATGRFATTWQFCTTGLPHNLSANTADEPSGGAAAFLLYVHPPTVLTLRVLSSLWVWWTAGTRVL